MLAKSWFRSPVLIAVALAVTVSGCAMMKKKPKEDTTYTEQPVDQLYSAGATRLDNQQWAEGISYFKEVERQHPYSEWSRRAILMEAFAHYQANQYADAVADADRFLQLYPGNPSATYAYYLKAECYFEQILDVNRDQGATQQALVSMREVNRRFPHTEYAQDARLKIDMINDQLAGKEMTVGRWYLRQGDTLAAIGRFKGVVDKYQTTTHTPEALYRLVEAYLTLGLVEEAKRNAAVLGYNFPGDQWYSDAYALMNDKGYTPDVEPTEPARRGFHLPHIHMFTPREARASTLPPPASEATSVQPSESQIGPAPAATPDTSAPPPAKKRSRWHWGPPSNNSSTQTSPAAAQ